MTILLVFCFNTRVTYQPTAGQFVSTTDRPNDWLVETNIDDNQHKCKKIIKGNRILSTFSFQNVVGCVFFVDKQAFCKKDNRPSAGVAVATFSSGGRSIEPPPEEGEEFWVFLIAGRRVRRRRITNTTTRRRFLFHHSLATTKHSLNGRIKLICFSKYIVVVLAETTTKSN